MMAVEMTEENMNHLSILSTMGTSYTLHVARARHLLGICQDSSDRGILIKRDILNYWTDKGGPVRESQINCHLHS